MSSWDDANDEDKDEDEDEEKTKSQLDRIWVLFLKLIFLINSESFLLLM